MLKWRLNFITSILGVAYCLGSPPSQAFDSGEEWRMQPHPVEAVVIGREWDTGQDGEKDGWRDLQTCSVWKPGRTGRVQSLCTEWSNLEDSGPQG